MAQSSWAEGEVYRSGQEGSGGSPQPRHFGQPQG